MSSGDPHDAQHMLRTPILTQLQRWNWRLAPRIHPILQRQFPQALWAGPTESPNIALTFDDGPDPRDTPALLEVLARHGVVATLFWLGERVQAMPELAHLASAAGHQIAIHGYRHQAFPLLPATVLREQIDRTRQLIADATCQDLDSIRDVRPPYGVFTPHTLSRLAQWQYRPVMWTVVPGHWLQPATETLRQVVAQTRAGAILVLHEGQRRGPPVATLTDIILMYLRSAGWRFVTVDALWQARRQRDAGSTRSSTG
jgi:peptidoglycan/xylan/chitin deacetylase (PgdA/CDA1 family)